MHLDEILAEDLLPRKAGDFDRLVVPLVHESANKRCFTDLPTNDEKPVISTALLFHSFTNLQKAIV